MSERKRVWAATISLLMGCSVVIYSAVAHVSEAGLPYSAIALRNGFGLRTLAPAPPIIENKNVPEAQVKLTGIVRLDGEKRVLLELVEHGSTKKDFKTLKEGDKAGNLEVVAVNEQDASVVVRINGKLATLSFDTCHDKAPSPAP